MYQYHMLFLNFMIILYNQYWYACVRVYVQVVFVWCLRVYDHQPESVFILISTI